MRRNETNNGKSLRRKDRNNGKSKRRNDRNNDKSSGRNDGKHNRLKQTRKRSRDQTDNLEHPQRKKRKISNDKNINYLSNKSLLQTPSKCDDINQNKKILNKNITNR